MKVNQKTSISTEKVLLVPYESHHVLKYHGWMQDPDIQEATASDPLSLEEEYENQQSWRTSNDKLTFIICQPLSSHCSQVTTKSEDADQNMRGDVNFFLYPSEEEGEEDSGILVGEVDVMVAANDHRGQGYGEGAVRGLLWYVGQHLSDIISEYGGGQLKRLMVKIKASNESSRKLFGKLGFVQAGEVNYFGEVTLLLDWAKYEDSNQGKYQELPYSSS